MRDLKSNLIDLINDQHLSPEAIFYIVKDLYRDAQDSYESYLKSKEEQSGD